MRISHRYKFTARLRSGTVTISIGGGGSATTRHAKRCTNRFSAQRMHIGTNENNWRRSDDRPGRSHRSCLP